MSWTWTARRLVISAFIVVNFAAVLSWVMPPCPIKERIFPIGSYYTLPLGQWQYWAMFAPDPVHDAVTLEAIAVDAKGLRYSFAFPKLADYSKWRGIPRFRHSKLAANIAVPECDEMRKAVARHVIRQLKLPASAFPVDIALFYQVYATPPPGSPPADAMTPSRTHTLVSYVFTNISEVHP